MVKSDTHTFVPLGIGSLCLRVGPHWPIGWPSHAVAFPTRVCRFHTLSISVTLGTCRRPLVPLVCLALRFATCADLFTRSIQPRTAGWSQPLRFLVCPCLAVFLALQVVTGLVSDDEISNTGPLSSLVSGSVVSLATSWHKYWGKMTLIALVMTHLAAIAWYRWRLQKSLVSAMLHGDKKLDTPVAPSLDHGRNRALGGLVLLLSIALVAYVISLGS